MGVLSEAGSWLANNWQWLGGVLAALFVRPPHRWGQPVVRGGEIRPSAVIKSGKKR